MLNIIADAWRLARVFLSLHASLRTLTLSSVARGGGGATAPPPIGMSTKMQNEKNITFLALLRLFYALEWTK